VKVDRRLMASKRAERSRLRVVAWADVPDGWVVMVASPSGGPNVRHQVEEPLPEGTKRFYAYDPRRPRELGQWYRVDDYDGVTIEEARATCERVAKWNRELKHPKGFATGTT
jgi:hypothetical protein